MAETDRIKNQSREETGDEKKNTDGAVNIPIEDGDAEESETRASSGKADESGDGKETDTGSPKEDPEDAKSSHDGGTSEKKDVPEKDESASDDSKEDEDDDDNEEGAVDGEWKSLDGKESSSDSSGTGFFKKKEKKDKKDIQIEELTDRVRRQMAEFDNFRKRTDKEKSQMFEVGAKSVIEKILPIVDSFERGLAVADKSDPFVEGMEKTYRQLMTVLESLDVKPIEAVGKEFDPNLHNAVMHVDDDSVGDNIVVEELQKGYTYRGSVVRYSMVKVAN